MDKKSATGNSNDKQEPSSAPPVPDDLNDDTAPTYEDRTDEVKESKTEDPTEDMPATPEPAASPSKSSNPIKRFLASYWHKKLWTLPLTLLVLIGIIAAVPQTRYPVLALALKRNFVVTVTDSKTNSPVSGASVTLDGQTATTDSGGRASIKAKVGARTLDISKQYYKSSTHISVFVGLRTQPNGPFRVYLEATGRQVPVKIINKITGQPVANAEIKALDTNAKTDAKGMANVVLPTKSATQSVTITASGYNDLSAQVQVTDKIVAANTFTVIPAGRLYFLSNLSGKLDVVSTNLDGSDRKTVLAGTGKEEAYNTSLLATRDWKYLALLSKRDGGDHAKLFLINTSGDQVTTMDEGDADFTPIGWSNHYFVYKVTRPDVPVRQPNSSSIKSYNADNNKLIALVNSDVSGTSASTIYQIFGQSAFLDDILVYTTTWHNTGGYITGEGKQNTLVSIHPDGTNVKILKAFDATQNYVGDLRLAKPDTAYFGVYSTTGSASNYYKLDATGTINQSSTITADDLFKNYPTYLISPGDKSSFWTEQRDGKNTLFVGDYGGDNGKQVASLSDYSPYGWFSDNYLLVQKNNSELYILPATGGTPLKISDYYKPPVSYYGYGGGYGGL